MLERNVGLCLMSEVWEDTDNKKHSYKIMKMLEIEGLKYVSTPRPKGKRGGGCAIIVDIEKYSPEKVDISIPKNLEVVSATHVKSIIAIAFYSPPKSKKKSQVLDHIITTCQMLICKYPDAGLFIGGDRNDLQITPILVAILRLKQIMKIII